MKPTDLDDLEPVEPSEALLERVHARGRALRRRRGTQRAVTVASGVVVLVFAVAIAVTWGGGNAHVVTSPSSTTATTTTVAAVTEGAMKGAWRPVRIADYRGPLSDPPFGYKPRLRFDGAGHFGGSDGCNDIVGTYQLGPAGAFHLAQHLSTLVLCRQSTPTPGSLSAAVRVELVRGRLRFYARDGHELARYVRVPTA